jgi:hypothetical protein
VLRPARLDSSLCACGWVCVITEEAPRAWAWRRHDPRPTPSEGHDLGPFRAGAPALVFALAHWPGWAGGLVVGGLAGWWEVLGWVSGGRAVVRTFA